MLGTLFELVRTLVCVTDLSNTACQIILIFLPFTTPFQVGGGLAQILALLESSVV